MSFGGGFGGFGSTNNTSQSTGFGGFGSTTNNSTGFGTSQNANTSFGSGTGGALFGSGGFGSNNTSPFGANKTSGFGSNNTTGGIFGTSNTSTGNTGFGGFGGTNNASSGFGANSTTGTGLFGNAANKSTTFGGSTGGGLFGSNNNTTTTFGGSQNQGNNLFNSSGTSTTECQGTGGTPFTPFTENEANSNIKNNFQSISFMQPYQKFSFEELRLADYAQGRRFGNASGQPGAFGQSTFGGFGSSNQAASTGFGNTSNTGSTGLFGTSNNASTNTFGTNQNTGFGGGLFGSQQNKPANTLFGSTTSGQSSGTLFSTAAAGSTGFGTTNNTGSFGNTGSNLFGQQKSGFSFGNANPASSSSSAFSGFGATAGSGGGLFGSNNNNQNQGPAPSLFGGNQQQQQQQQNSSGNLFGQQQNRDQNNAGFGAGFQPNQQRPTLFGSTGAGTGGTGLFGNAQNNQAQNTGQGLFGTTGNQNTSSLFGKPASTGTNLFGGTNTNAATNPAGPSLFGGIGNNNQPQQNAGSIFGSNQQQQQKPGLFGGNTTSTTGNLFPNNQANNQAPGLFVPTNPPNQPSIFNTGPNNLPGILQPNSLQQPQGFTASINDPTPYGSASIFNGLPPPPQDNPGPIATPISAGQKQRKPAALPQYKINPAMASRLVTPRKPPQGYGFSYSTYGSPSSVSSVSSTPGGLSNSLLGNSLSRNLGKSLSLSNLRRTFDSDSDSVLSPGAFSPSSSRYSGGSLKKLTIDRSLRSDLFGSQAIAALPSPERNDLPRTPSILKKKVSFDAGIAGGEIGNTGFTNGSTNESTTPSAQEQGYLRPSNSKRTNGGSSSLVSDQPEIQQTTGKELAIVPEDGSPEAARSSRDSEKSLEDPVPGAYWTKPALEELKKMTPSQLKSVSGFVIGREGCGQCKFNHPVDLSNLNLDELFGKYTIITIRSITIYPTDVSKPPVGMGMNVPSTLTLENSWPRKRNNRTPVKEKSGPRLAKHVDRLSRGTNTEFVNYDAETGCWTFKVPHFTTYGLNYDDDDDVDELSEVDVFQSSFLSEIPPTPTPKSRAPRSRSSPLTERLNEQDSSILMDDKSHTSSGPDDTFGFKVGRKFPGAFDDTPIFDLDHEMEETEQSGEHFLDERSVSSLSSNEDEPSELEEITPVQHTQVQDDEIDLVGSFPTGEPEGTFPKSILKTSQQPTSLGTPARTFFGIENDWTEQLQRTISPKKQDREALRQSQAFLFRDIGDTEKDMLDDEKLMQDSGKEFATSIDLMNSLFGKEQVRKSKFGKQTEAKKGFKWPYPKSTTSSIIDMNREDRAFHNSFKPTWGPKSTLLYASDDFEVSRSGKIADKFKEAELQSRDLRFSFFKANPDITDANFRKQQDQVEISIEAAVPVARAVPWNFETGTKYHSSVDANSHERLIWELASILFNEHYDEIPADLSEDVKKGFQNRAKKDRLAAFWARLCREEATIAVAAATSAEERAIAFLSMNKVTEACNALIEGNNYRLATLIAQIGGDQTMHDDIAAQIDDWRKLNVLSEISDPVRALYELLAGNTCMAIGKKGPLEDRAKTFVISERFGMSWKRAFGLKLWYSTLATDPLESAVQGFLADLSDYDTKRPTPWFLTQEFGNPSWGDPHSKEREDVLWGLLKLYADQTGTAGTLSEAVGPENANDNPLSTRLSFELYHTLATHFPRHVSSEGGDKLTLAFATELNSAGQWLWALFVLLRLSDASQRQRALEDLLAERAGDINEGDHYQLNFLFKDLKIPQQWVWEAKALYSRAVSRDYVAETRFLLKAENWDEAHNTLCTIVAPQSIIERSYSTLQQLLDDFNHKPSTWRTGGGVYSDYLQLVQNRAGSEEGALLGRLIRVLGEMHGPVKGRDGTAGHGTFLKKVAIQDMSAVVGDKVLAGAGGDAKEQAWILQLPLTGETRRARAAELSWGYYRKIMAAGS